MSPAGLGVTSLQLGSGNTGQEAVCSFCSLFPVLASLG